MKQSGKELAEKFQFIQIQEDERLRDATIKTIDSRWSLGVSVLERNDSRNRYVNIMPYERNRVKLDVIKGNDYINASYVKINVPGQSISPGYYIATQGPTKKTWGQFWQMCYHSCSHENIVIVMVTPLKEHGRAKCFPYWPTGEDNENSSDHVRVSPKEQYPGGQSDLSCFEDELEVICEDSRRIEDYYTLTTHKIKPRNPSTGPAKMVHHFYFDQWKDMSKPEEIVPIMKLCEHSHRLNSPGNPIIVHCSAGVGRSGTFITLDHLIHDTADFKLSLGTISTEGSRVPIEHYNHDLIEQIVLQLRSQRLKMVQMIDQYMFIYHAAKYLYDISENSKSE